MTALEYKAKKRPFTLVAISFFYTIFCVYMLDFTTIYGIIDKLSLKIGYNMLCDLRKIAQDIVMNKHNNVRKNRIWVGGNEGI